MQKNWWWRQLPTPHVPLWPQKHLLQAAGGVSLKSCPGPGVGFAARVKAALVCRAWALMSDPGGSKPLF